MVFDNNSLIQYRNLNSEFQREVKELRSCFQDFVLLQKKGNWDEAQLHWQECKNKFEHLNILYQDLWQVYRNLNGKLPQSDH